MGLQINKLLLIYKYFIYTHFSTFASYCFGTADTSAKITKKYVKPSTLDKFISFDFLKTLFLELFCTKLAFAALLAVNVTNDSDLISSRYLYELIVTLQQF